jgi:hypothetical protein
VQEEILAEEQERGLHPPDRRDLSAELGQTHMCVDRINSKRTTKVGQLLQQVMEISSALVDLCLLPVQDITQLS